MRLRINLHGLKRALILVAAYTQLAGCANGMFRWPYQSALAPAPAPVRAHRQGSSISTRIKPATVPEREVSTKTSPSVRATKTASAPPVSPTVVSLGDDDGNRTRAESLLRDAQAKLAKVDRSKLTSEDAAAYNQASGLVEAARKAINEHDYLAAAGLAQKASVISGQVATHSATP